jgi:hypothetical protein
MSDLKGGKAARESLKRLETVTGKKNYKSLKDGNPKGLLE